MHIGVVAPFNPFEFGNYLDEGQAIPNINKEASAVNAIVEGFLNRGHHVTVISAHPAQERVINLSGSHLDVHLVSTWSKMPKAETFKAWYMVARLKELLRCHVEDMEVIHAHWTYQYAMAALPFAQSKPVFCTIRDWAPIIRNYQPHLKGRVMWWLVMGTLFRRVMHNRHVHFIANSQYIRQLVHEAYPQMPCHVIENPVKSEFILSNRVAYPQPPVLVSIAQDLFDKRKNIGPLLQAFQLFRNQYPQARLILVGNYNSFPAILAQWRQQLLLKNVELKGFVDHDKLIDLLDQASILVHPSLEESFGNTLLEGMSRRIPVIGGEASGAVPYVLNHGEFGFLCDVTCPESIAKAMTSALDLDAVGVMVDKATRHLQRELNEEIISEKHITFFSQFLRYE